MMEQNILNTILENTFTLTQLRHRLRIVKSEIIKLIFEGQESSIASLNQQDYAWLKTLPHSFNSQFNKDNVYLIFENLQAKIDALPVLIVYIPFQADETIISQIGAVIRNGLGNLVFDIKYDASLIGGAAFSWKGIYRDYSLRARIEEKKSEILNTFRRQIK